MASLQPDIPNPQRLCYFDPADPPQWRPRSPAPLSTAPAVQHQPSDRINLISWNIDFQVPAPNERMSTALQYLDTLIAEHNNQYDSPTVIFFQEMVASDLNLIEQALWIREKFYVTDISPNNWRSSYGTVTLIDKRLTIQRVFRIPYALSRMQRDVLFVDVVLNTSSAGEQIVRLCNTHLESLASGIIARPSQLKLASEFMQGTGRGADALPIPHAAILAGDLNAFEPEDAAAPMDCGLTDAFLVLGGTDGTDEAYTWGKQCPAWSAGKFPDARMDKVLFCGGVEALSYRKIGEGLKARVELYNSHDSFDGASEDAFEELWVTDHAGLNAEFRLLP
ncbi:Endonuclease/exonuclease/phosphatase [Aspergillus californicus]